MRELIRTFLFLFILFTSLSFQTSMTQFHIPKLKSLERETQLQRSQTRQTIQVLNAQPLYFVENEGQVDKSVRYHAKIPNANVFFTPKEIVYQFFHRKGEDNFHKEEFTPGEKDRNEKITAGNIRVSFEGANEEVKVEGLEENMARFNFFQGNDPEKWVQGATAYKKVIYRELYSDIDLIVYGGGGKIKHEYRVRTGGKAENIRIMYEGVEALRVNEEQELEVMLKGGKLREEVPKSYQRIDGKRVEVKSGYRVMKDNVIGFRVGEYDKDRELIIDPQLSYSTYLGGSDRDHGDKITVDGSGNAYITGSTESADFPANSGNTIHIGSNDVFVTKLNSSGSELSYSTFLGGSYDDYGSGIAVDGSGSVYIAGVTDSFNFPTTSGGYDSGHNGSWDVFITKLNSTGSALFYSTFLGSDSDDRSDGIAIDGSGSAYVTGMTESFNFPTTSGAYDSGHDGGWDVFITKLNSSGSALSYSTFLGGSKDDYSHGIAIDGSGNAYVTGRTESTNFPITSGAYDASHDGGFDVFVTKLNSSGSALSYSTYLGGSLDDTGWEILVDGSGSAFVTGGTESTNFPTTSGAYDTSLDGTWGDAFIAKLNSSGSALSYSTFLGGSEGDYSYGIAIDGSGSTYVTGSTSSTDFPTTSNAYDTSHNGEHDVFVAKLNSSGSALSYSTFLGGSESDHSHGIALDGSGNAYVTGDAYSVDFPITSGAYDTSLDGTWDDVFVTKLLFPSIQLPIFDGHDFNGNGSSDVSVFRPKNGRWYIKNLGSYSWGMSGDVPVSGDYNGDGTTDIAMWRPANGRWYLKGIGSYVWGTAGDIPVPGNYDGDVNATTDIAVWRLSNGHWYIKGISSSVWGTAGDIPVPGDYDGDGTADIAVWRPSNGRWYIKGVGGYVWGTSGDIPVPADYNGDGVTDIAVWRPSNGRWYIKGVAGAVWGAAGDIPAPGDYNGDGITDIAVWRPSNGRWYIKGIGGYVWGVLGDIPLVR